MTFIIDRGIYSMEVFKDIIENKSLNLITWEKGYKKTLWDEPHASEPFLVTRPRNHAHDFLRYEFRYIDQAWKKNPKIRQIIVKATNPKNTTIEVSVLATDPKRSAQEIIQLIFKRWIQENDFKYLIKHFGINEITSYSSIAYEKLINLTQDKKVASARYKAYQMNCKDVRAQLKTYMLRKKLYASGGENKGTYSTT